ncbi:Crp/Fnr family transcriptional regulator [Marinigracilibium pacificum]|uniref:Crp/Fnr family transcriptional regulator n=1 Tax=Marinigracilibium pacificum TaxID=2729599 RepID=A0A848JCF4_9BACT|nr:Crp/Fnr family transcriptional regulator [Marinigracilibium pacificum]NMM50682.1 Crp/Fnr family transcriptional regulator [Marinigracilibium pacificum]
MNKAEIINFISQNHSLLSTECKNEFTNITKSISGEKGTTLVKDGQLSDKIYYLIDGCARAFYIKDGRDISDWFAFENEFICSINSFFQNIPSPHYIELLENSTLLEISRDDIDKLSNKYPDFDGLTKVIITKTMLQLQERISSIQFQSAEQRYNNMLTIRPNITQRIPLTHIASYIGITLETLSRIRKPKKAEFDIDQMNA